MKKVNLIALIAGSFLIGGVSIGSVVYTTQKSDSSTTTTDQSNQQPVQTQEIDKISGYGMSPTQMFDELNTLEQGSEFDWRYMNYLQTLRMNEIGMSNLAERKAEKTELKQAAVEQKQLSTALNDQLTKWRSLWGFTDH